MDGSSFDRVARTMASAVTRRGSIAGIIGLAFGLSAGDDASARRRRRRRCTALYSPCSTPSHPSTCCTGGWCYSRPVDDGGILDRGVCRECGTLGDYCDNGGTYCCLTYQGNPMSCNGVVCVI